MISIDELFLNVLEDKIYFIAASCYFGGLFHIKEEWKWISFKQALEIYNDMFYTRLKNSLKV